MISELEAAAKAATPGPWVNHTSVDDSAFVIGGGMRVARCNFYTPYTQDMSNACHIALANPENILRLTALCRLQHEAIVELLYARTNKAEALADAVIKEWESVK